MRKVAIVAPDFAPSSHPPALRARFLSNHLVEFGWTPTVVTVEASFYEHICDPENLAMVSSNVEVLRVPAFGARWTRVVGIGDIGIRSFWHAWRALRRLCAQRAVDVVYIPVPPSVPMVLGRLIRSQFNIPYVIDYMDPWITEYYWQLPRSQRPPKWALAYLLARVLEPFAIKGVAHLVAVSNGTIEQVLKPYPCLSNVGSTEIPLGGERADFEYLRSHPRPNQVFNKHDGNFHLTYAGAFITAMDGPIRSVFASVRSGLSKSPQLFSKLRMHFVGTSYASSRSPQKIIPLASEFGLSSIVDERPSRISYLDALQVLIDSSGLLILGSIEPHYTASKIFPYLLSERPIVALFHEGSNAVEILRTAGVEHVATFGKNTFEVSSENKALQERVDVALRSMLGSDSDRRSYDKSAVEKFSARSMSARLAGVLDRVVEERERRIVESS